MYSEHREQKCVVCKTARPTCGDPKLYCRDCATALQEGRGSGLGSYRKSRASEERDPNLDNIVRAIEDFPLG